MNKLLLASIAMLCMACQSSAQLSTRVVKDNLFIPWELVAAPDNHIWFTQKNGYICRVEPVSGNTDTLYHETNTSIQSEGGMLGMAMHPSFPTSPYVYVAYNYNSGGYQERVVRYTYDNVNNVLTSPLTLLDNIDASNIHNGCRLTIVGDKLFISTGDAATASIAQNATAINGKILRINLDGTIPSDNPFPGNPVWSWGHRNAQGMVYAHGKLILSEHGDTQDDEINIVEKGRNYGWPNVKGYCNTPGEITFCNDSNVVEPIMAWTPTLAVCGITYYDHAMFPQFANSLLMTTLKDQKLYKLTLNGTYDDITDSAVISGVSFGRLRAICTAPNGKIYISTSTSNASGSGAKTDRIIEIYDPSFNTVPVQNVHSSGITVYPNPAGDKVTVRVDGKKHQVLEYSLTDVTGKTVAEGRLTDGNNYLQLLQLSRGIYQLRVTGDGDVITMQKISKQ